MGQTNKSAELARILDITQISPLTLMPRHGMDHLPRMSHLELSSPLLLAFAVLEILKKNNIKKYLIIPNPSCRRTIVDPYQLEKWIYTNCNHAESLE